MTPILAEEIVVIVMACVGGAVAIISVIACNVRGLAESRAREVSRREIAAYIAEGSITPEQGERLLAAGNPPKED